VAPGPLLSRFRTVEGGGSSSRIEHIFLTDDRLVPEWLVQKVLGLEEMVGEENDAIVEQLVTRLAASRAAAERQQNRDSP
jgi:hypothetical protein